MLLKNRIRLTTITIMSASVLLSGCSLYPFHSNVDKENFKEYFKTSKIQVLTKEQLLEHHYQVLGTLEGHACQEKDNQPPADKKQAQVDLIRQAADMPQANAVVFSTCASYPADNVCYSSVSCYGKVVQVLD
ncbi:Rcs stress response system protein RcsF [Celerinatantimonas sp. YJH-8]|uniref:Rcs stress response system protein RcsF n=1 Tax=Celerinatantimonas sp. YJH-8 TaxID=3228714 RepID=UPI0038BE3FC1